MKQPKRCPVSIVTPVGHVQIGRVQRVAAVTRVALQQRLVQVLAFVHIDGVCGDDVRAAIEELIGRIQSDVVIVVCGQSGQTAGVDAGVKSQQAGLEYMRADGFGVPQPPVGRFALQGGVARMQCVGPVSRKVVIGPSLRIPAVVNHRVRRGAHDTLPQVVNDGGYRRTAVAEWRRHIAVLPSGRGVPHVRQSGVVVQTHAEQAAGGAECVGVGVAQLGVVPGQVLRTWVGIGGLPQHAHVVGNATRQKNGGLLQRGEVVVGAESCGRRAHVVVVAIALRLVGVRSH